MKFIPYQPWHFEYCASKSETGKNVPISTTRLLSIVYGDFGHAYTLVDAEGEIVGCAGVCSIVPRVAEAWTMFTEAMLKAPFFTHRHTLRILKGICESGLYHRVQAMVVDGDPVKDEWVRRLGFTWECSLEKACSDGSNMSMWKRVVR